MHDPANGQFSERPILSATPHRAIDEPRRNGFSYVLNCVDHGTRARSQNPGLGVPANPRAMAGDSSGARNNMFLGGLVFVAGLVITIGHVEAWGAVLLGAMQFLHGLSQWGQKSSEQ